MSKPKKLVTQLVLSEQELSVVKVALDHLDRCRETTNPEALAMSAQWSTLRGLRARLQ